MNVRLNGINYRSEKTKNAFAQALQDGHKVSLPAALSNNSTPEFTETVAAIPSVKESNGHVAPLSLNFQIIVIPPHLETGKITDIKKLPSSTSSHPITTTPNESCDLSHQLAQESKMQTTPEKLINFQRVLESLEYLLTQFQQNQAENLQVHGTYLNHQMEYAKTFFQLMQQQNALFANTKSSTETAQLKQVVMESLERSMMQFHSQQGETLRIHEQYLQEQVEYAKNFFQLIQQEYSQLLSEEVTTELAQTPANQVSDRQFVPFTIATPVTEAPVPPTAKIVESQAKPVQQPVVKVTEAPVPPVWEIQPEPVAIPAPVVEPSQK